VKAQEDPSGSAPRTIHIKLGRRSYDIVIGDGLVDHVGDALEEMDVGGGPPSRALIVTDSNVGPLYAPRVEKSLERAEIGSRTLVVPPGEKSKCADQVVRLWDEMLESGVDRRSVIVALGGGVVGDLAGFVAATLLRGVAFLQVPTSLLAQVDSSVGGKTGIDRPKGKNLVGAFWQPLGVLADPATLKTLPERELRAGLAEVVKTGIIRSRPLFKLVESHAEALLRCDAEALGEAVERSCQVKAKVVGKDERDTSGERAVLNFGHTVGHAVEAAAGLDRLLHGEAVAIGMVAAGRVALKLGLWDEESQGRLEKLLARLGLPTDLGGLDLDEDVVVSHLLADKKAVAGEVFFVLPEVIGKASLHGEPVPEEFVRGVVRGLRSD
jgi:3-dehydroquinate synthase